MFGTPSFDELKKAAEQARAEQEKKAEAFRKARELGPLDLNHKTLKQIQIKPIRKASRGEIIALLKKNEDTLRTLINIGHSYSEAAKILSEENGVTILKQTVSDYCRAQGIKKPEAVKRLTVYEVLLPQRDEILKRLRSGEKQVSIAKSYGFNAPTFNRALKALGLKQVGDKWVDVK